jgi:hypothetical protein
MESPDLPGSSARSEDFDMHASALSEHARLAKKAFPTANVDCCSTVVAVLVSELKSERCPTETLEDLLQWTLNNC